MQTIRSILWIGPGAGLSASGVAEAPGLDVTWVPDVQEAFALPQVHFDATVLEGRPAMELGSERGVAVCEI